MKTPTAQNDTFDKAAEPAAATTAALLLVL